MRKKFLLGIGIIIILFAGVAINAEINARAENKQGSGQQTPSNQTASGQTPNQAPAQSSSVSKSEVQVAPDFTLTTLQGEAVSLSSYRGKNVYLNFWASWCPPCRQEMPDMEEIHREYKDRGLVVLTVNLGEDKNTVQKFIGDNGFTFPVLLDSENKAAKVYKITSIPVSVFINKDGVIVAKRVGMLTKKQMEEIIKSLPQ